MEVIGVIISVVISCVAMVGIFWLAFRAGYIYKNAPKFFTRRVRLVIAGTLWWFALVSTYFIVGYADYDTQFLAFLFLPPVGVGLAYLTYRWVKAV